MPGQALSVTACTVQGMARVRSGQALASPLSFDRTGSAVKDAAGGFFGEETSRANP